MIEVIHGDCLEVMKKMEDNSIDCVVCDLPYGTTACAWDIIIPFDKLREQYNRIVKEEGAIILFGSQPFSTDIINSNRENFRYEIIWEKDRTGNFLLGKKQVLKYHENILVFYRKQPTYNPQMTKGKKNHSVGTGIYNSEHYGDISLLKDSQHEGKYPKSVLYFQRPHCGYHPTEKPVELCNWLVSTYSNKGDLVLDNTAGSGTTGVVCKELGRDCILIEKEKKYIDIIHKRLENTTVSLFY